MRRLQVWQTVLVLPVFRVSPGWSWPEWFRGVGVGEEFGGQLCSSQRGSYAGYFFFFFKDFRRTELNAYTLDDITAFCLLVFIGGSQFQSSAPVNIPGSFSTSAPFSSPSPSPPIRPHTSPFFSSHLSQPGQSESTFLGPSHSSLGLWTFMQDILDEVKCVLLGQHFIFFFFRTQWNEH